MKIGTVVLSTAGRDAQHVFCVIAVPQEGQAILADGRLRRVDKPKRKKCKHLARLGFSQELFELVEQGQVTNRLLRRHLSLYQPAKTE